MDFVDIENVKDGDEITNIRFECLCGRSFETVLPDRTRSTLLHLFDSRCSICTRFSGFELHGGKRDTPDVRAQLLNLFEENLKSFDRYQRQLIQELLAGRNLKMSFAVKSNQAR